VTLSIIAVTAVTAVALGIGSWGVRFARTTSDLFVASRAVSPWLNAAAISGEYLSAASFLGIAGLQMKIGAAALWLPVGFTAGYLALLLFVAAPLRRYGAYTIADFAEARLSAPRMRLLAASIVLLIAGFYLVPQLKGAGLTLREITGAPYWVGVIVVALIVALSVSLGGMRGITYVQAFQYWVKVFAIALPACILLIHLGGIPGTAALFGQEIPRAPREGLVVELKKPTRVVFPERITYTIDGRRSRSRAGVERTLPAGRLRLSAGAAVPLAEGIDSRIGREWAQPISDHGRSSPLLVYSLLIATFLGTMGLPHILVRFYTNPDGPAARRTTVRVLGLLGLFYMFPVVYGLLGRSLLPGLYVTGETDSVVLRLPAVAWPGLGGEILAAVIAAGAFAAFMSTASGLLVSVAGTLSFDVRDSFRRGPPKPSDRRQWFRLSAVAGMVLPAILALVSQRLDISLLVGWAFALAASTFCPLLLLGIWWSRLTTRGAAAGMIAGAVTATGGILVGIASAAPATDVIGALVTQPAIASVPLAFLTMVGVSLLDNNRVPNVEAQMVALHAPEGLGLRALGPQHAAP
jgi:Na+(H+)/acetate symporter ActP